MVTNIYNETCPSCGRDKMSTTIFDDGKVLKHCFRASCNYNACIRPTGVHYPAITHVIPPRGNPYEGTIIPLTPQQKDLLHTEVGFEEPHFVVSRPMFASDVNRYAFPLLCPEGHRQGFCLRSYAGMEPKALTYLDVGSSRLSYYWSDVPTNTVVLTEDVPSAVRSSLYVNTIAILGTSLTEDDALEVSANFDDVIIILDNDATRQALLLQKQLSILFTNVSVVVPRCDLKDMPEGELCHFLTPLLS